jgi:hypothetical protein
MGTHKPGRPSTAKASETRRDTRTGNRETRVQDAEKQMERKPFENGG